MPGITLSKRLNTMARMTDPCDLFTDIGCDHALLPLWLIDQGIAKKAVASDINQGPLASARSNANAFNIGEDRISFVLSDGLKSLDDPGSGKNTLAIAGMGGLLIRDILDAGGNKTKSYDTFLLSPHTKQYELRKYLFENGFFISDESYVCEDDKLYVIIKAAHAYEPETAEEYTETELRFGRYISKAMEDNSVRAHIMDKYIKLQNFIDETDGLPDDRRMAVMKEAQIYREVLGI